MSIDEFNALPLEARRFIEQNTGCLSCGNSKNKLTNAYALYLNTKKMKTYQLFGGGINFKEGDETGVLYNINSEDTDFQVREKIRIAKLVFKARPHAFISYDERSMNDLLESLCDGDVIDLDVKSKRGRKPKNSENNEPTELDELL